MLDGGSRATPGGRYAWLEQGRVDASPAVLGALSRALRLDDAAARHLMGLAGHAGSCVGAPPDTVVLGQAPVDNADRSAMAKLTESA